MPISPAAAIALAHNGNLTNAHKLRTELVRDGAIFQSTSDTEAIIHLVARSSYKQVVDRLVDALKQVEGAYSLVALTAKKLIGVRDPFGVRPLVLGDLDGSPILASETCALDIIGADLRPRHRGGRTRRLHQGRHRILSPVRAGAEALLHLRICLFRAAGFDGRRRQCLRSAEAHRRRARA